MRHQQAGLTLLETVLVLLVAAIIIGGIWLSYSEIRLNQQVGDTVAVIDQAVQVTRDYVASQTTVPNVSATNTLSINLYNAGVMPANLSYSGVASVLAGLSAGTQVFKSPLGHDFFVQYPNGGPANAKYFEIRVGFVNVAGSFTSANQCLRLMPKLIGTTRIINDRGLVGYSYGGTSAWNNTVPGNPGLAAVAPPLPTWTTNAAGAAIPSFTQQASCQTNDVRLYFAMRP